MNASVRNLHGAEVAHLLLALLLLFEQLLLAGDVAAVALGEHVLAHGLHRLARDDACPPMAAWIGTSKSWRGMFSFSFSHDARRARG